MKEKTKKSILTFGIIGAGFIALMSLFKGKSSNGYTGGGGGGYTNFDALTAVKPDSLDVGMDNLTPNGNVKTPTNIKRTNLGTNDISDSGIVDENLYKKTTFGLTSEKIGNPTDWYLTENNSQGFVARNAVTGAIINTTQYPTEFIKETGDPNSKYYNPTLSAAIKHANKYGLIYAANPDKESAGDYTDYDQLNVGKLKEDKLLDNDDNSGSVGSAGTDYYNKVANKDVYKTEKEFYTAMGNIGKRH